MQYTATYASPVGELLLAADDVGLTGLWLPGEKYFGHALARETEVVECADAPVLDVTRRWLDVYFAGDEPGFMPPLHPAGTPFQHMVWDILLEIPYGATTTYGEIAREVARRRGLARMSSQAVGSAVGHNEISIVIPCHRVVGADGSLTGYAGGIAKKAELLRLEGAWRENFNTPKFSTAL